MSAPSVLFDAPGPRTVARHRLYAILTALALAGFVAFAGWRLWETGQLTYAKWEPFLTPRYISAILVDGLLKTLQMAAVSIVAAVVFGLIFGMGKLSDHKPVRWVSWVVVEFFRAVPVLMLMILGFFAIFSGIEDISSRSYWSVILALMLYNGAVLAEVFRAGVQAVPKGQSEAAYAIGMRKTQVMREVLLPQGVKIMIPAIISQMVVALKDTSLGYYILAPGLTALVKPLYQNFNNHVAVIIVIGTIYILVNLLLTGLATLVQRRLVGERSPLDLTRVGNMQGGENTGGGAGAV